MAKSLAVARSMPEIPPMRGGSWVSEDRLYGVEQSEREHARMFLFSECHGK